MSILKGRKVNKKIQIYDPVTFRSSVDLVDTNMIGDTYYVRNNGSDTNDGKTPDHAFKTLQRAVAVAGDWDIIRFLPATDSSPYLVEDVQGTDDSNIPIMITQTGLKILGPLNMTQWGSPAIHTHTAAVSILCIDANQVEIGGIAFHIQAASGGIEIGTSTNPWRTYIHDCYFGGNGSALFGIVAGNYTGSGIGGYHRGYADTTDAPCTLIERCSFHHMAGPGVYWNAGYGSILRDSVFAVSASTEGIRYDNNGTSRPFSYILDNDFTAASSSTSTGITVTNTPTAGYFFVSGNQFVNFGSDDLCCTKRTGYFGLNYLGVTAVTITT